MPSPRIEVFFIYNETTGVPQAGVVPTFQLYKDDLGNNVANPAITEIGGGAYKFTPVFADAARGIVYLIDSQSGNSPRYQGRFMRPEDWADDDIQSVLLGKWQIVTTGPDTNRLVLYREDGVTVLKKFDLTDSAGAPTVSTPFTRTPV